MILKQVLCKALSVFVLFVVTSGCFLSQAETSQKGALEENLMVEVIQNDEEALDEPTEKLKKVMKAKNWMEFSFGCADDSSPIEIYVVPSCTHCVQFLATDFKEFLNQYGQLHKIIVKFILSIPSDFFILKLFYNAFLNAKKQDPSPETLWINMFWDYIDYMGLVIRTGVSFEQAAIEYKFSQEDVENAAPDAEGNFEKETLREHTQHSGEVSEVNETKELDTPYIIYKGKHIGKLEDALD